MNERRRSRFLVPFLLPVGLLALIAVVLVGFSRILLAVTHTAATATALAVAVAIVVAAAVANARKRVSTRTLAAMATAVTAITMLVGGSAVLLFAQVEEGGEDSGEPVQVIPIVAQGILFTVTEVTVPADEPFDIEFDNQDAAVQHNVEIFETEDFSGEALFKGEIVTGPAVATYRVEPLAAGTYYFNCVVHPATMLGTIEAVPGGSGGGGGGGGGAPTELISASALAFDTDVINIPAGAEWDFTLDNLDAGIAHNISIYSDEAMSQILFKGDLLTGPGEIEYEIPALEPGTYYFHCDIHPTMAGSVIVA